MHKKTFFQCHPIFYKIIKSLSKIFIMSILLSGCSLISEKKLILNNHKTLIKYQKNKIDITNVNIKKKYSNIFIKYVYFFKKNDHINTILKHSGVNLYDILNIIKIDDNLKNIKNNQKITWKINLLGQLIELKWYFSEFCTKTYKKYNNKFYLMNIFSKNSFNKKNIYIKKNTTFFTSAYKSGLNTSEINSVIKAMQWQINFRNLQIGSYFNIIFLKNSKKTKNNKTILLGVKLNNVKKKHYSIKAFNEHFYDSNGLHLLNNNINILLIKKYRISSKFNFHRYHPITHRISHHLGIDFAAPQNTSVFATHDGKITQVKFDKIAGFYIVLKNIDEYQTKYMHLKKILVRIGQNIKQGQKIALSGNTGRTTGPHLHYELWINNHAINPIIKHIYINKLTKIEKKIYLEESKNILSELDN